MRHFNRWLGAGALGICLLAANVVQATTIVTLVDKNSSVQVDPRSSAGMFDWQVNQVDQLQRQWFWYRIGAAGAESSIDTLAVPFAGITDTNFDGDSDTVYLRYTGAVLKAELTFTLMGAGPGVMRSDIVESIRLTNLSQGPLDLHFFQFCNLDLGGAPLDQSVGIAGGNTAQQQDISYFASETVHTPLATYRQVGFEPAILNDLLDAAPTTLSNSVGPVGPGDLSWAFQWDMTLGAAGSGSDVVLISKDKQIVPEPLTALLLGLGALMLRPRKSK